MSLKAKFHSKDFGLLRVNGDSIYRGLNTDPSKFALRCPIKYRYPIFVRKIHKIWIFFRLCDYGQSPWARAISQSRGFLCYCSSALRNLEPIHFHSSADHLKVRFRKKICARTLLNFSFNIGLRVETRLVAL